MLKKKKVGTEETWYKDLNFVVCDILGEKLRCTLYSCDEKTGICGKETVTVKNLSVGGCQGVDVGIRKEGKGWKIYLGERVPDVGESFDEWFKRMSRWKGELAVRIDSINEEMEAYIPGYPCG